MLGEHDPSDLDRQVKDLFGSLKRPECLCCPDHEKCIFKKDYLTNIRKDNPSKATPPKK